MIRILLVMLTFVLLPEATASAQRQHPAQAYSWNLRRAQGLANYYGGRRAPQQFTQYRRRGGFGYRYDPAYANQQRLRAEMLAKYDVVRQGYNRRPEVDPFVTFLDKQAYYREKYRRMHQKTAPAEDLPAPSR